MSSSTLENEHVLLRDRQFHRRDGARCGRRTNRAQVTRQDRTSPRPSSDAIRSPTTHRRRAVVKHGQRVSVVKVIDDLLIFNVLPRVLADLRAVRNFDGRDQQTTTFSDRSLPSSWTWRGALSLLLHHSVPNNSTCSWAKYRLRLAALLHRRRVRGIPVGDMRRTTVLASPMRQHLRRARIRIGDCCLPSIRGHVRFGMVFLRRHTQPACAHSFQRTDAGLPTYLHGITSASLNTAFVTTEIAPTTFKLELPTDT